MLPTDVLSSLFNIHKLPFKVVCWVCLSSGIALFAAPLSHYLRTLLHMGGHLVMLVFIASLSLLLVNVLTWLWQLSVGARQVRRDGKEMDAVFLSLDPGEEATLMEFKLQNANVVEMPLEDSCVVGLESKGIIEQLTNIGYQLGCGSVFNFGITEHARGRFESSSKEWAKKGLPRPSFVEQIATYGRRGGHLI